MKFRQLSNAYGVSIDWKDIPHGTKLMKVTLSDDSKYDDISTNNEKLPKVEIHALITEDGKFYILEEDLEPRY